MKMKKVLIVGAAGFVGGNLIQYIQKNEPEWDITATKMPRDSIKSNVHIADLDITDMRQILSLLDQIKPDYIFHLAAQSSVAVAWKNPQLTIDINIKGTVNLLDAVREKVPYARMLLIGSGEEYGHVKENEIPISEDNNTRPGNIYAVTKVTQNMIGKLYADAYGMNIMSTRSFNHTGPDQKTGFVVPDFCKQVADIEAGKQSPTIKVGNIKAKRDFTDVRDVVRAYCMIMKKGISGNTYNVGTGHAISIEEILNKILSLSMKTIQVETDPDKLRPLDVPVIEPDISKLQNDTGWKPEISIDATIQETLNVWRKAER
jgi:GDP-4-dehydro-6-deoxy-D-mannose reductase